MNKSEFKCGTVAFIGAPNAGKSTLLNSIIGCEVAITSSMAGTTRNAIRGILNTENAQIIFVDTPGMQESRNLLEKKMNRSISGAVKTADVICYMIDVANSGQDVLDKLANYKNFGAPVIVIITKVDKVLPEKIFKLLDKLRKFEFIKSFIPASAKTKKNVDLIIKEIINYLPNAEKMYEDDEYTDITLRDMASEIIRGEVINTIWDEVPKGVNVIIKDFKEEGRGYKITADILCDKLSHKKIIIGAGGKNIQKIGTNARKKIEKLTGKHIVLNTFVIVKEGWRDKETWIQD